MIQVLRWIIQIMDRSASKSSKVIAASNMLYISGQVSPATVRLEGLLLRAFSREIKTAYIHLL